MTTMSNRKFGVEIEFCTDDTQSSIASKLAAAGINVRAESYNHTTRPHWKIVTDSSVTRGFELVSPVLSGLEGIVEVQRAVAALVEAGCSVDTSCGLHVHVDANDLTAASVVNIMKRYATHESTIDTFVPSHRRINQYARSVVRDAQVVEEYLASNPRATTADVCRAVYDRYRKLNITSFVKHGTVEFRQHSGSIDGTKIANWIQFCVQFVQDSIVEIVETVPVRPAPVQVPAAPVNERANAIARKFRAMLELFVNSGRYVTVSAMTIAQTLDISEASVPSYVSMFRDRYPTVIIKSRRGRGYYSVTGTETMRALLTPAQPAATPVPQTLGDLIQARMSGNFGPVVPPAAPRTTMVVPVDRGPLANLPVAVRAYYQERAVDFR